MNEVEKVLSIEGLKEYVENKKSDVYKSLVVEMARKDKPDAEEEITVIPSQSLYVYFLMLSKEFDENLISLDDGNVRIVNYFMVEWDNKKDSK